MSHRGTPSGSRREVTSRVYAGAKTGEEFLGVLVYTLDARQPVFIAAEDCSGRAATLQGTNYTTLKDRLVETGYVL